MSNEDEEKLTLRAKQAIRGYLLRLIIPMLAGLTGIAFILGFFLHDLAYKSAEMNAYKDVQSKMHTLLQEATVSVTRAKQAEERSLEAFEKIGQFLEEAEETKDRIEGAEILTGADEIVKGVSQNLSKRDDFRELLAGDLHDRVSAIEGFVDKERPPSSHPIAAGGEGPWGKWRGAAYCPSNQYVCGMEQKIEGNQGDGDDTTMNGVRFYCCSL